MGLYNIGQGDSVCTRREPVALEAITPELLNEVRDTIVKHIAPDRIILFGSASRHAEGMPHDIDLYIIKSDLEDRREAERRIERLFEGRLFALDILVSTPEQVDRSLRAGNSFLAQEVLGKGRILYERAEQPA
jgi:predicted nucleotidyltransferase